MAVVEQIEVGVGQRKRLALSNPATGDALGEIELCDAADVRAAVERARKDNLMTMLEAKTYRWYGHSRSDPRAYRTKAEEKAWHARDPITVLRGKLTSEELCGDEELDGIKDTAFKTIEDATQFGIDSPWPDPADVAKDVYVEESYSAEVVAAEGG